MSPGAPGIIPVTPPTNPQVSGLDALAIGPVPGVLTTTYDSIRQWIRPGVPQFRTFPLQPKAKTSAAASATVLQEIAAQNNSAVVSGLNWKGVWNSFTTYARFDVVQFNSSTYMALQSSVNVKPDFPTPSWILLSENFVYKGQWAQPGTPYTTLSLTITGVTQSGGNTIYAYSSFTGQAPALGMKVSFSGWGSPHNGNNITAILTGVSGGLSGTVTIANGSGSTVASGGTGVGQMFLNGTVADSVSYVSGPWTAALPTTIAGNILFAFAFWDNNSTSTATIVDTLGNTWHQIQHITGAIPGIRPNTTMYLWWCASKGGATSITVTPNSSSNGDLAVYEIQGPLTLDQNAAAYTTHGTPTLGPSVTTTSINEQIIAFLLLVDFPSGYAGGFAPFGPVISTGLTPFIARAAATIGTYTPGVTTATWGNGCITTSWAQQVIANSVHIPFDVVEYLGSTYVCIAETTAVPTDTGFWVQLSQGAGGVNNITGAYLTVAGDYGKLLTNTTASNYTVTLPAVPPLASWWLAFQQSGSGTIIINPNGLTIDGSGSNLTLTVNQGVLIFTDGINYFTERGMGSGGGFTNPMTTLGDIIYENVTPAAARLAGNITAVKQFLSQTGTGSVSAAPAWATLVAGDIPNIAESQVTGLVGDLATLTSNIALKAPLASPALTGTPTAPTPATADNSTTIVTSAFVKAQGYSTTGGSRHSTNWTTGSLLNGATETGTVTLGKTILAVILTVNVPSRIRLYSTSSAATADVARAPTTPIPAGQQNEIIMDVALTNVTGLTWVLSPAAWGSDGKVSPDGILAYNITNNNGSTGTVTATLKYIILEG